MSVLLDHIKNQLSQTQYESMAQAIGADPNTTKSAVSSALPILLGALSRTANTNSGLNFLTALLDKNNDGSVIDDILGMVIQDESASSQGSLAIQQLLGKQTTAVEQHVAENSGLEQDAIRKLLPLLAPLVMGALTKAQSSNDLSGKGLRSFLEKESTSIGESNPEAQSLLTSMIDQNKDGSMVDDVLRMGMNAMGSFFKK